jgi:hypothetical protein
MLAGVAFRCPAGWWSGRGCRRRASPCPAAAARGGRPPPNPGPPKPRRGRRDPPAPLLDFNDDIDNYGDGEKEQQAEPSGDDGGDTSQQRRRQRLEAAYQRVVSDPRYARDGDVRLYFKKRRLLAERAEESAGEFDDRGTQEGWQQDGARGRRPSSSSSSSSSSSRSWVDDNDALPKPETALKLSADALAQVIEERSEALAEALVGPRSTSAAAAATAAAASSRLLTRHPRLLSRPTSALAAAVRGHVRSARLGTLQVLELAAEAPRMLLAHPDAAEARAGLLQRAMLSGGGGGRGAGPSAAATAATATTVAPALLWRYPSALGTARVRLVVEWAEALAAAVASSSGQRLRGPPAGAPAAGVAEGLAVLAAGVELMERRPSSADEDDQEEQEEDPRPEGYARDPWLRRAGPDAAARGVAALAARLLTLPTALPLFPLLRAEPALLLEGRHPLRIDAWRRLEVALAALEALFGSCLQQGAEAAAADEEEDEEQGAGATAAAASRAVLLAPPLVRVLGNCPGGQEQAVRALKDALRGMATTEWLFFARGSPAEAAAPAAAATASAAAAALARQHPRLLLLAAEAAVGHRERERASAAGRDAMEKRADRLARRLARELGDCSGGGGGVSEEEEEEWRERVRRAAQADPSLLAAPPPLVSRASLRLARGLMAHGGGGGGGVEGCASKAAQRERARAAALWGALFPAAAAAAAAPPSTTGSSRSKIGGSGAAAAAGAWAAAERGWLPLQLRALCTCLRLPAARVRSVLLLGGEEEEEDDGGGRGAAAGPRPPALLALAASPAELRVAQARLSAAFRRLAERRRRHRRATQRQPDGGERSSSRLPLPPASAAAEAERVRAALPSALAAAALAPGGLNAAAVASLDACSVTMSDAEVVEALRVALWDRWGGWA